MPIFNTEYKSFKQGWEPGANTVAYFPLDTDLLDHGPNNQPMTNYTVSLVSGKATKNVAYFNGSSRLLTTSAVNLPGGANPKTISVWVQLTSSYNHVVIFGFGAIYSDNTNKSFMVNTLTGNFGFSTRGSSYDFRSSVTPTSGQWYHLCVSYNGSSWVYYINGVSQLTGTTSIGTTGTKICLGATSDFRSGYEDYMTGYLSDAIIENKARTAQEIADYYNQTKANYGL